MRRLVGYTAVVGVALAAAFAAGVGAQDPLTRSPSAQGVVFEDANRNGKRDAGEAGLRGVRVSNGRQVVKTDRGGRWRLPVTDDTGFFVIKPRGWMTPLNEHNLPQFYYLRR